MNGPDTGTFAGQGGVPIHWKRWMPAARPRGVVVVAHGYAEHLGRYESAAMHWAARGLAVVALDHRGHGRSGGPRGHCRDFREFTTDLRTLVERAAGWWPDVPRVLFGHSMGGLIAFLYLLEHGATVRAGALSGPALRVPDQAPRWLMRIAMVLARIVPRLRFKSALEPDALARDPEVGRAYVADPLVHRAATAGFVRAFREGQDRAFAEASRLTVPLLILQGEADRLVDPRGAREIEPLLAAEHEVVLLPGYFHELLNEPLPARAIVLKLLDAWFDRWLT